MIVDKLIGMILLCIVVLTQIHCNTQSLNTGQQVNSVGSAVNPKNSNSPQVAPDENLIQQFINLLSSDDDAESANAQAELINLAIRSSLDRKAIIDNLIISVEKLDLENRMILDTKTFRFWSRTTTIFGKLQAIEAIDLLIKYIYLNNGMASDKHYNRPAEGALAALWPASFPKLSEALLKNPNPIIRGRVALLLGDKGGLEAKQVLEHAMQAEVDRSVLHNIETALSTIARENR